MSIESLLLETSEQVKALRVELTRKAAPVAPRLLTYAEAAQALRCSQRIIERMVHDGTLPTVTPVGTSLRRVPVAAIEALVHPDNWMYQEVTNESDPQ